MSHTELPLGYTSFRKNLQNYVSTTTEFKDVNYEGSGINQLLNILAYSGSYMGYYLNAAYNEQFLDTAQMRTSILAGAKRNGYVVRGRKSSRAEVKVERIVDNIPDGHYIRLDRSLNVVGTNKINDTVRNFLFNQDVYLYDYERLSNGKYRFYSDSSFTLYQGKRETWRFTVTADTKQRFIIKDATIDIDTLKIHVKNTLSDAELGEEYIYSKNAVKDFNKDAAVFHIATAENGWYEIFFGQGIIGKQPSLGQYIICEYMSPTGEDGDGCDSFKIGGYTLTTVSPSFGGSNGETDEAVKNNAKHSFRRQNRLFTDGDIKTILLEEFRNIKSINVWGGEDNYPKQYGKTMIAIKPNNSDALSQGAKIDIKKNLLNNYGYTGMDIQLVDPEYINVDISFSVNLKQNISDSTKKNALDSVLDKAREYSTNKLNQFGYYLNDVEMNKDIMSSLPALESVYSIKTISKEINVNTNNTSTYTLSMTNAIEEGTVKAQFSDYNYTWSLTDEKGKLFATTVNTLKETIKKEIGTVDYTQGIFQFNLPLTSPKSYPITIEIFAQSTEPNIYSKHVNIVRIRHVSIDKVNQGKGNI